MVTKWVCLSREAGIQTYVCILDGCWLNIYFFWLKLVRCLSFTKVIYETKYSLLFIDLHALPPSLPLLVCMLSLWCADMAVCLARWETCLHNQPFSKELNNPQALPFLIPAFLFHLLCQHGWFLSTMQYAKLEWEHTGRGSFSSFVSSGKPTCRCSSTWVCWTTCDLLSPCREPDGHLEHAFLSYSYCITLNESKNISNSLSIHFPYKQLLQLRGGYRSTDGKEWSNKCTKQVHF